MTALSSVGVLVAWMLVPPLFAQGTKVADLRRYSEAGDYYLVFAAHNQMEVGHAFVVWGREDYQRLASLEEAYGLYPVSALAALRADRKTFGFSRVPGQVVDEALRGSMRRMTDRLIVRVNSDTYARARAVQGKWTQRGEYQLLARDCVSFLAAVAAVTGLHVPSRAEGLRPHDFVKALMAAN